MLGRGGPAEAQLGVLQRSVAVAGQAVEVQGPGRSHPGVARLVVAALLLGQRVHQDAEGAAVGGKVEEDVGEGRVGDPDFCTC